MHQMTSWQTVHSPFVRSSHVRACVLSCACVGCIWHPRDAKNLSASTLVYGEIMFEPFGLTFEKIKKKYGGLLTDGGVFYDIGSGTGPWLARGSRVHASTPHINSLMRGEWRERLQWRGWWRWHGWRRWGNLDGGCIAGKPCFAAALLHNFDKCVGVEILTGLHEISLQILDEWRASMVPKLPPAKQQVRLRPRGGRGGAFASRRRLGREGSCYVAAGREDNAHTHVVLLRVGTRLSCLAMPDTNQFHMRRRDQRRGLVRWHVLLREFNVLRFRADGEGGTGGRQIAGNDPRPLAFLHWAVANARS